MSSYISLPMFASRMAERLRLEAGVCKKCNAIVYPRRVLCPECGGGEFTLTRLSGRGRIYSYTIIAAGGAPAEFDDQQTMTGAIVAAIVELEEGPRLAAQIVDASPEVLRIGLEVEAAVRRLFDQEGIHRYGTKFAPTEKGRGTGGKNGI